MKRHLMIAPLLLVAACQKPAETAEQAQARMQTESATAKTEITARTAAFAVHMNAKHDDSLANMYTENAMLLPPNMPAVTGRAAIRTWLGSNGMPPGSTFTLTTVDVAANGPLAVERGTFNIAIPAAGHTPAMNVQGKYLAHWHKVDATWRMADDIWNENAASMPAPPMAAAHH
jgi:ketosteroid isomerase-like protein